MPEVGDGRFIESRRRREVVDSGRFIIAFYFAKRGAKFSEVLDRFNIARLVEETWRESGPGIRVESLTKELGG